MATDEGTPPIVSELALWVLQRIDELGGFPQRPTNDYVSLNLIKQPKQQSSSPSALDAYQEVATRISQLTKRYYLDR